MSRPKPPSAKVETVRPAPPLQNAFAALGEIAVLQKLKPVAEPAPVIGARPLAPKPAPKKRGRLVLRRETKDRGGKVVVVISGLAELPGSNAVMIGDLSRELKGKLGCGGSFDRQEIVLQGDRCAEVTALLEAIGYRVDGVRT